MISALGEKQQSGAGAKSSRRGWLPDLSQHGWPRPLATLTLVAIHVVLGHEDYSQLERLLAGLAGGFLLNVIWTYSVGERDRLPVLPWVTVQLYVFFAMPIFSQGTSTMSASFQFLSDSGAIRDALVGTNLFLAFLLVGWLVVHNASEPRRTKQAQLLPIALLIGYGLASLVVAWLLNRYEVESKGAWYRQILRLLFLPGTAQLLLLFEYQRSPQSRAIRIALIAFTAMMVLVGLFSSRLGFALIPLVTAGIGVLAAGARLPKRLSLLVLLLVVVVNPAKHVYRELTGYRTADFSTQTLPAMVDAWLESLRQTWSSDEVVQDEAFALTAERFNSLTVNAAVFAWVPDRVSYAKGGPWLAVPYSLVPRFFWAGKPNMTEMTNDRFAVEFGMSTRRANEWTTLAYPSVADGYWNFGWLGIVVVALLAGLFWKLVSNAWSPNKRYQYVLPFLLLIETQATVAFSGLLLGLLQTAVACFVVVRVLEMTGMVFSRRTT